MHVCGCSCILAADIVRDVMSCHVTSRHVMSCHVISSCPRSCPHAQGTPSRTSPMHAKLCSPVADRPCRCRCGMWHAVCVSGSWTWDGRSGAQHERGCWCHWRGLHVACPACLCASPRWRCCRCIQMHTDAYRCIRACRYLAGDSRGRIVAAQHPLYVCMYVCMWARAARPNKK